MSMCAAVLPWPERWGLCGKEGWPGVGAGPEGGPHSDAGAPHPARLVPVLRKPPPGPGEQSQA